MAGKKIAFVANTSWSIYKFRLYLINELIKKGFAIYVIAPYDKYTDFFKDLSGLEFVEIKNFDSKNLSPKKDIALYKELLGHYKRIQPDLIFHYTIKANIFGTLAAARCKRRSISVITGLGYAFLSNFFISSLAKMMYTFSLKKAAATWFLNKEDQAFFINNKLVPEEKIFLLPGEGINADLFYPAPDIRNDTITFLMISRIIRHKGVYEYIHAAEILRSKGLKINIQLLGFFEEENPVAITKKQIDEWVKNGILDYLGDTDNVVPFIEKADCIVLPSYREGIPLSLLEGASMCKALIATNTAGCKEIVTDNVNGYLCAIKNAESLAEKMEKYYHLPAEEKRQMGLNGREIILKEFTNQIIVDIYLKKINEQIGTGYLVNT